MDWYPRYPALWRSKTRHLNPFQEGCYLRLVDEYMETRQPLPDMDAALARICGISVEQWLSDASAIVRLFFKSENGMLFHDRCDTILNNQDSRQKINSEKGKKGAEIRYKKNKELDSSAIDQPKSNYGIRQDRTEEDIEPPISPFPEKDEKPHARRTGKHELPNDFTPNAETIKLCAELNVDIQHALDELRDWAKSKRPRYNDWQATFRNSIRRTARNRKNGKSFSNGYGREPCGVVAAALRVADRLEEKNPNNIP